MLTNNQPKGAADIGLEHLQSARFAEAVEFFDKALQINPHDIDSLRHKAEAMVNLGEEDGAVICYEEVCKLQPEDALSWVEKGDLLTWLNRLDEALASYERATTLDSTSADIWRKKGLVLRNSQRYEEAHLCYDHALRIKARDPENWWGKGDVFLDQGQPEKAFECFAKGQLVDSAAVYGAAAWSERGNGVFDSGNPAEALHYYEKSIECDSNHVWGWRGKGLALEALKRVDEALQCFDRALELAHDDDVKKATVWLEKGNVLLDQKQYPEAAVCYDNAIRINPDNFLAWMNKGTVLRNQEKYSEALVPLDKAIEVGGQESQDSEAWASKGFCLAKIGKFDEAIRCYDKAIELAPNSIWALNDKGYVLIQMKRHRDAIQVLERAIALDSREILPRSNKAVALRALGLLREAQRYLEESAEVVTDRYQAYLELGNLLADYGDDQMKAIETYRKALEIRPDDPYAIAATSECLVKLGRYSEARQTAQKADQNVNDELLRCVTAYLVTVTYALEGDRVNWNAAFEEFLRRFKVADPAGTYRKIGESWNYNGLWRTIARSGAEDLTKFLLLTLIDLQIGNVEPSAMAFFRKIPELETAASEPLPEIALNKARLN
jgi:tetratricopeptide (TPR) repeat protein